MRGQVSSEAECSAAGPWGLVATIEGIMAREAQASMTQFLDYCAAECTALRFSLPQVLPWDHFGACWGRHHVCSGLSLRSDVGQCSGMPAVVSADAMGKQAGWLSIAHAVAMHSGWPVTMCHALWRAAVLLAHWEKLNTKAMKGRVAAVTMCTMLRSRSDTVHNSVHTDSGLCAARGDTKQVICMTQGGVRTGSSLSCWALCRRPMSVRGMLRTCET